MSSHCIKSVWDICVACPIKTRKHTWTHVMIKRSKRIKRYEHARTLSHTHTKNKYNRNEFRRCGGNRSIRFLQNSHLHRDQNWRQVSLSHETLMTQSREIPMKQSSVDIRGTQAPAVIWKSRLLSLRRPSITNLPLSHYPVSVHVRTQSWEGAGDRKIAYKFRLKPVSDYLLPIFLQYARQRNIYIFLSLFPVAPTLEHRASVKRFVSLQFLNPKTVGRTAWTEDQPVARPLPIQDNTNRINTHTNFRAMSGIRTNDPTVQASEDSSCLRPRGHCDRQYIFKRF
jgi:hypothetical protein